jgi:hypothetical protein
MAVKRITDAAREAARVAANQYNRDPDNAALATTLSTQAQAIRNLLAAAENTDQLLGSAKGVETALFAGLDEKRNEHFAERKYLTGFSEAYTRAIFRHMNCEYPTVGLSAAFGAVRTAGQ